MAREDREIAVTQGGRWREGQRAEFMGNWGGCTRTRAERDERKGPPRWMLVLPGLRTHPPEKEEGAGDFAAQREGLCSGPRG